MDQIIKKLGLRFDKALAFASSLHRTQKRKGTETEPIPYIGHLLSVAGLVIEDGGTEEEAIAALLHDAVEDQGGAKTLAAIRKKFGKEVADIVSGCTDTDVKPKPPWRERKERYVEHLKTASPSVKRVCLADKLHNLQTILRDYRQIGESLWQRFKGKKGGTLWYYQAVSRIIHESGYESALLEEPDRVLLQLKNLVTQSEQEPSAEESTPGRWESEEEIEEFHRELGQALVDNLNENVMTEHLENVEKGYSAPDEDYFQALRMRSEDEPQGLFLHPTPMIEKAIREATRLHEGESRKGEEIKLAYVSHPISVAEMLARYTQNEDILVAAILHDTLEDGKDDKRDYTKEELSRDFGEKVCHIVEEVTEDLELKKLDNKGTWRERKILYLAHLYRASFEAIMVCCADKIHNLTNMIQLTNKKESSRVWSQFNSPPEDRLWFYKEVTLCLQKKLNHPIVRELEKTFEEAEKVIPLKKNQGAIEKMTAVGHPFR